jgi:hypothetical protein
LAAELGRKLSNVKEALARVDSYDKAVALRAIIGTRSKQSELMTRVQKASESGSINANTSAELGRLWNHLDRQVEKLEKKLAPSPEQVMRDREPGEDEEEALL